MTAETLFTLVPLYVLAAATPGPNSLAIIGTALTGARGRALILAAGTITGSVLWALMALSGLGVVLARYAGVMEVLRIAGGLYLLFLAWKSARSAFRAGDAVPAEAARHPFRRGLAIQMTNPKALLFWVSVMSLGAAPGATVADLVLLAGVPLAAGAMVFLTYALVFSTGRAARAYGFARRPLEAAFAAAFGYAGVRLLTTRVT